jgi:hypothetical protein
VPCVWWSLSARHIHRDGQSQAVRGGGGVADEGRTKWRSTELELVSEALLPLSGNFASFAQSGGDEMVGSGQ